MYSQIRRYFLYAALIPVFGLATGCAGKKVNMLQKQVEELSGKLGTANEEIKNLRGQLGGLDDKVKGVESQTSANSDKISTLTTKVQDIEAKPYIERAIPITKDEEVYDKIFEQVKSMYQDESMREKAKQHANALVVAPTTVPNIYFVWVIYDYDKNGKLTLNVDGIFYDLRNGKDFEAFAVSGDVIPQSVRDRLINVSGSK